MSSPLTIEEARAALKSTPVPEKYAHSWTREAHRVRAATAYLISEFGFRPEQIIDAMTAAAFEVCPRLTNPRASVSAGIADGLKRQLNLRGEAKEAS